MVALDTVIVPWKTSAFKIKIDKFLVPLDKKVMIVEVGFIKIYKNVGITFFFFFFIKNKIF